MNAEERAHEESLVQIYTAHLRQLEIMAAKYGALAVPSHISLEIEENRRKITEIGSRLHVPATARQVRVHHNLPPRDYERFVGRQKELAELRRLLQPYPKSRAYVVAIDGIGGIGKSSLALEAAYLYADQLAELSEQERFEAIVWVSAKRMYLTAGGIRERRQVFRTLTDVFASIARVLEYPAITRARSEEQREIVEQALRERRTLLILDNLETVDDDELMDFLHELPDPTKALITTRQRIDVARPVRLTDMPPEDAAILISQEATRKDVALTKDEQEELLRRTGGMPLAIVWSIGLMGLGGSVNNVLRRLSNGHSDIARFCFEESVGQIRKRDAYKLLLALSLFSVDAGRTALGVVAGFEDNEFDRDGGLEELLRLSLVNKEGERFSLLPLTRSFVMSEAEQHTEWLKNAHTQWQGYFYKLSQGINAVSPNNDIFDQIECDLANLMAVIDSFSIEINTECTEEGDIVYDNASIPIVQQMLDLCDATARICYNRGYWNECERLGKIGIDAGRAVNNLVLVGWRFYNLSRIYGHRDEMSEAHRCAAAAREAWERAGQTNLIPAADSRLGMIAMIDNRTEEATKYLTCAMHGYELLGDSYSVERALSRQADLAELRSDFVEAANIYRQIIDTLNHSNRRGFRASILSSLGRVSQYMGDYESALAYYTESLEIAYDRKLVPQIGRDLIKIAQLNALLGEQAAAIAAVQQGLTIFRRLGMKRKQNEAEALLAKLTDASPSS